MTKRDPNPGAIEGQAVRTLTHQSCSKGSTVATAQHAHTTVKVIGYPEVGTVESSSSASARASGAGLSFRWQSPGLLLWFPLLHRGLPGGLVCATLALAQEGSR